MHFKTRSISITSPFQPGLFVLKPPPSAYFWDKSILFCLLLPFKQRCWKLRWLGEDVTRVAVLLPFPLHKEAVCLHTAAFGVYSVLLYGLRTREGGDE